MTLDHLAGTRLPPGAIRISAAESEKLSEVLGSPPPDDGTLHPIFAYSATQRGIGVSVAELCALADFDVDDGPMLGSLELDLHAPMVADTAYRVEGEILSIERKRGHSGTFDLLKFQERLVDDSGATVSAVTMTFVLPRREVGP